MKRGERLWFVSSRTLQVSHTVGLLSRFLSAPNPYACPKSIDIEMGWPTSLTRGERLDGDEDGYE